MRPNHCWTLLTLRVTSGNHPRLLPSPRTQGCSGRQSSRNWNLTHFNEGTASYKGTFAAPALSCEHRTTPLSEVSPDSPIWAAACHLFFFSHDYRVFFPFAIIIVAVVALCSPTSCRQTVSPISIQDTLGYWTPGRPCNAKRTNDTQRDKYSIITLADWKPSELKGRLVFHSNLSPFNFDFIPFHAASVLLHTTTASPYYTVVVIRSCNILFLGHSLQFLAFCALALSVLPHSVISQSISCVISPHHHPPRPPIFDLDRRISPSLYTTESAARTNWFILSRCVVPFVVTRSYGAHIGTVWGERESGTCYVGKYMEAPRMGWENRAKRLAASPACIPPVLCRCRRKGSVNTHLVIRISRCSLVSLQRTYKAQSKFLFPAALSHVCRIPVPLGRILTEVGDGLTRQHRVVVFYRRRLTPSPCSPSHTLAIYSSLDSHLHAMPSFSRQTCFSLGAGCSIPLPSYTPSALCPRTARLTNQCTKAASRPLPCEIYHLFWIIPGPLVSPYRPLAIQYQYTAALAPCLLS